MKGAVEQILGFCDFLALRLHTENLELLRRVVTEFHATPRTFETVDTLLATGYPAISILPVGMEPQRAHGLLKHPGATRPHVSTALCEMYDVLYGKIEVTNWHWLLRMYEDYCNGVETTVEDFVARRSAAIAMYPIPPIVRSSMDDTTEVLEHKDDKTKVHVQDIESVPASPSAMEETSDEEDLVDVVRRAQQLVERKAPWERIYDVAMIEYPFDSDTYPGLALCLLTFWEEHARAVWERHFWAPLSETDDSAPAYYERKKRQYDAATSFTNTVIIPAFATFGAQFFVDLDAQGREVYWWWYRRPLVDLMRIARAVGVDKCVQYTKKQSRKRVPSLPPTFEVRTRGVWHETPMSMWSAMAKVQHISDAIEASRKAGTKASKRRRECDN